MLAQPSAGDTSAIGRFQHHRIERMKDKSRRILEALYRRYFENPRLLPVDTAVRVETDGLERTIADYIAGMTDRFALDEHRRIFGSDAGL